MSTALGIALGGEPTAVLIGDVAFLHDINALLAATRRGVDLTVAVVDNDGGGLFEFLPQADTLERDRFEQLFGTPHGTDIAGVARAHGATVHELRSANHFSIVIDSCFEKKGVHVIVITSDREVNVTVHDELHRAVQAAVERR
jgi:2-succinyl-5-enolpyruvyl-6-hydroxy-3-cyclohexene-1-carboxylate synthase